MKKVYAAPAAETSVFFAQDIIMVSFGDNDGKNPWTDFFGGNE